MIESLQSYIVAILVLGFSAVMANAPTIMTVGGMVLLGLRLYVDGKRALAEWRGVS